MPVSSRRSILATLLVPGAGALARQAAAPAWRPLFDGHSLEGWSETPFPRHGPVMVEKGAIVLGAGQPMTGINYTGTVPQIDYEVRFEAARLRGGDFFASLTFPVGSSWCTWVLGGWGGDIVGLSSIDGWDASDNETRTYFDFEPGRFYALRVRVRAGRIEAWIDDRRVINVDIEGRTVSLRHGDIKLSAPFGFASYNTTGAIRKVELRTLAGPA